MPLRQQKLQYTLTPHDMISEPLQQHSVIASLQLWKYKRTSGSPGIVKHNSSGNPCGQQGTTTPESEPEPDPLEPEALDPEPRLPGSDPDGTSEPEPDEPLDPEAEDSDDPGRDDEGTSEPEPLDPDDPEALDPDADDPKIDDEPDPLLALPLLPADPQQVRTYSGLPDRWPTNLAR